MALFHLQEYAADRENGNIVTVLFTQNSSTPTGGIGNTQAINGIGTHCTVAPFAGGSAFEPDCTLLV